jgi:hypothetical protein
MSQIFDSMNEQVAAEIEAKRDWVRGHYEPRARHKYETLEGKLALLDAILANGWVAVEDTLKLQCLGIAVGDALAQHLHLDWVVVEDEYGRDPALNLPGTSILAFPMTSISKRIERGEAIDVFELFNAASVAIREQVQDGA